MARSATKVVAIAPARKSGRPPKLVLEQVLDAAIEIGLEEVTIAALAEQLGTGIAAIYRLVESRDHLLRLGAERLAKGLSVPKDRGQSWAAYLVDYGEWLFNVLVTGPNLLTRYLEGALDSAFTVPGTELVLAVLCKRGLAPVEALRALEGVTLIVGGAASKAIHQRAARARGMSHDKETRRVIKRSAEQLPLMSQLIDEYADEAKQTDWRTPLLTYLRGIAMERGETNINIGIGRSRR
jgi:AcrR family transcriptional regulator